jgi:hypothetical protein
MINKVLCLLLVGTALACSAESEEARRIEVPVVVDTSALFVQEPTDLGYRIEFLSARGVIKDLTFTQGGEVHTAQATQRRRAVPRPGPLSWIIGTAHAHPGHLAGGDVLGELPGRHVINWLDDGAPIGTATVVAGPFDGAGFVFAQGEASDGLTDPLLGQTLVLEGTATRDGNTVGFIAAIDQDSDRQVVGIPFIVDVDGTRAIGFGLIGAGLFDGIDFHTLAGDAGQVTLTGPDLNRLRRATQSHEHFTALLRD